ncbi:hypothetical protein FF011L_17870 [Roseimaritima multifibrata]|uniref:Uncharacterized protein n=1 Tax=Roseimaritima multifibrata TaxID=1930274 RepID=A0A517MDS3_9BACT|nr:hypothetical protein [Roseimaritima multifibrata]QDS93032.1 hypothetical protein FF011L_17870 [Roseimaritima multifibrata]
MSSIPAPVRQVLQARSDATLQKIDMAVLAKHLDVQQQAGDSVNELLQQNATIQRQLAAGYLDVRV